MRGPARWPSPRRAGPSWSGSARRARPCSLTASARSPASRWPRSRRPCPRWNSSPTRTHATPGPAERPGPPRLRLRPARGWARAGARLARTGPPASEEQGGEGGPRLGDPGVPGREDVEQADQVPPGLVPVLARGPPDDAEQPVEGVVDAAVGQVEVGDLALRFHIVGAAGRGPPRGGLIVGVHPPEQIDLGQALGGYRVAGIGLEHPLE